MGERPKGPTAGADEPTLQMTPTEASAPAVLERGTVLAGRFEVGHFLGGGGAGMVYAARDHLIGEAVAIKLLHESLRAEDEQLRRLRQEVRAARRIAHPNVCRVHDLCEAGGLVFVVMERVNGETLRSRLRERLPLVPALDIARQLAAGLGAAHRAGVVHCDVKPENAIVADDRVVLTDFGVARRTRGDRGRDRQTTGLSSIQGTPAYMSPEQILGRPIDERTDVYALAAVIYELLFGAPPFGFRGDSATVVELLDRILHAPPSFPEGRPAEATPEARAGIVDALRRGLAKDPADRPDSVEALIAFVLAAVRLGGGAVSLQADAVLQPLGNFTPMPIGASTPTPWPTPTPTPTPTPEQTPTGASRGATTPRGLGAGPYRGARRIATVVHLRVDEIHDDDGSDEEETADRAEAVLGAAELTINDAGGVVVGRVPRSLIGVFGAVSSRGDEPQRAAEAARAIAQTGANAEHLALRVGCDTGRLLVRASRGGPPTVSGSALQRAERLASTAEPGQVLVSRRTARHLASFELADAGADAMAVVGRRRAAERAVRTALIGRDDETEVLVRELNVIGAGSDEPRAALIVGPPGIGKTRLAREVEDLIVARGGVSVLRANAQPADAFAAHAVIRAMLRRMLALSGDVTTNEARAAARRALARSRREPDAATVDALAALLGGSAVDSGMPALAAARAALSAAARRRPVLLVVEDLHWADDASLDLFEALARREVDGPIGLLATARVELLQRRPRMQTAFRLAVPLAPLGERAATELAHDLLGPDARDAVPAIVEAAEGNPFFLEELALSRRDAAGAAGARWPTTIEEAIQSRMDRLTSVERDVLRAAALLGREFRVGDLAALLDEEPDAVLRSLELAGVVLPLPPDAVSDDRYAIRHTLVRDAAYAELPPAARRELHASAAAALRDRAGADPSVDDLVAIAQHLEGADERAKAAAVYRRAGDASRAQADVGGAFRCYQRAHQLIGDADSDIDLLIALGELAGECAELELAERTLCTAIQRAEADPRLRVHAARGLRALAAVYRHMRKWTEAVDASRRGLALVDEQRDPVLAARLLGTLGWVLGYKLGNNDEGLPLAEHAVELLEGGPHRAELAKAYSSLGACYMSAGRWNDQLRCNRRHLEIGEELGDLSLQATAHLNLGENLRALGVIEEAVEHSRRARDVYARMAATTLVALARNNVALSLVELGDLEGAEQEAEASLAIARRCGGLYCEYETLGTLARVAARRGDFERAVTLAREAVSPAVVGSGGSIPEGTARRWLGGILSLAGEHEEAMAELAAAEDLLAGADAGELAKVRAERSRCLARAGRSEEAEQEREAARGALEAVGARHELTVLEDLGYC